MAMGRLVAMASGRTIRGAVERAPELAPRTLRMLQQDHGEEVSISTSSSSWSPLGRKKKAPCSMLDVLRFANARSGVASTPSRRDEILEREEETTRHSGPNVFEAEAYVGRVECCGKGCRPVYEEDEASTLSPSSFLTLACPVANFLREDFPSPAELQIKVQPRIDPQVSSGGLSFRNLSVATSRSLEFAMQDVSCDPQHLSDFAIFSWKSLGDVDKAEGLYQEALDHVSCDKTTDILASYANFLWQCDQ